MPGDSLSQEEIDALFSKAFGGDESEGDSDGSSSEANAESDIDKRLKESKLLEKKAKIYDFKNPKILSKEHMRIISLVHENYAKHLSSFLSGYLRTECVLTISSIEEQRYYEYNNALAESVLGVVGIPPIEETILIEMKKDTCYAVIERLLGGPGDCSIIPDDFSDIELRILRGFCEQITNFFKSAWSNVMDVNPVFRRIETNSRLSQLLPLDEIIIIVAMNIKIMEHSSSMSICIPCVNLENVLSDTSIYMINNRKPSSAADVESNKEAIFSNLKTSKVDIRGVLGNTSLSLKDLLQLQIGDYVLLDKPVETPIVLKIGASDWFNGEIGTKKNKIAVKIKDVLQNIQ